MSDQQRLTQLAHYQEITPDFIINFVKHWKRWQASFSFFAVKMYIILRFYQHSFSTKY